MTSNQYQMIDHPDQLAAVVSACQAVPAIALDTEFARFSTYYPILGLVQIYTGSDCFIIDPLAIQDLSPLADILADEKIVKVLHACSEDMEVFQHALDVIPTPVYDTQIAGAVLGIGFSVGYQAMVEHYLSITLPKDQTRSDWIARPLSDRQLEYAALDVIHLLEVFNLQQQALAGTEKAHWVESESVSLGQDIPTMMAPDEYYKKLKGLWQLTRPQLHVLKTLCAWREELAREEDVPRNRVVDQKALLMIARDGLQSRQALQQSAGLTSRQVRKYGDAIIDLLAKAVDAPASEHPALMERTDAPINNRKLKKLKQVVEATAKEMSIAPELLTKRRHLEKLIRSEDAKGQYHLPNELDGWRRPVIGEALLTALAEHV